jgi:hypothetical protein
MKAILSVLSSVSLAASALSFFAIVSVARAQVASTPPAAGSAAGWTFSITPYVCFGVQF